MKTEFFKLLTTSNILKERRINLRLTQQEVAEKAGILLQQYQKFESGERKIESATFQTACKIIEALDMDITKFYHREYLLNNDKITLDIEKDNM
jgi:transcriptional regulator with XRE-family HTH domain